MTRRRNPGAAWRIAAAVVALCRSEDFASLCTSRDALSVEPFDVRQAVLRLRTCGVAFLRPGLLPMDTVRSLHEEARRLLYGGQKEWISYRHDDCWHDEGRMVVIPPRGEAYDELPVALAASPLMSIISELWPGLGAPEMSFLTLLSSPRPTAPTVVHHDMSWGKFLKLQYLLHDLDDDESALLEVLPGCAVSGRFHLPAEVQDACRDCHEEHSSECGYPYRVLQLREAGTVALYAADLLHTGLGRNETGGGVEKVVLDINLRVGMEGEPEDMVQEFPPRAQRVQEARTARFAAAAQARWSSDGSIRRSEL